ncbi:MAG: 2'-5' RNA ligase family protein [Actinomycetia bacterium]|nr:2'-5' RNA ligase family protein [Actinomycetes bacterium]
MSQSALSALVVEVAAAESLVGHWRRRHDSAAGRGMPAHITALFPFRAPESLARIELQGLTNLAAQTQRHRYALGAVDAFDTAIFLRPFPDEWFRQLTARLFEAFPDCPPYGGAYPDVVPHLTVAQTAGGEAHATLRLAIEAAMSPALPIACEATALSLFINENGQWTLAQRFPFG